MTYDNRHIRKARSEAQLNHHQWQHNRRAERRWVTCQIIAECLMSDQKHPTN